MACKGLCKESTSGTVVEPNKRYGLYHIGTRWCTTCKTYFIDSNDSVFCMCCGWKLRKRSAYQRELNNNKHNNFIYKNINTKNICDIDIVKIGLSTGIDNKINKKTNK